MIISKAQVQNILQIYNKDMKTNRVDKAEGPAAAGKRDALSISPESKIMQKAMQAAKQAPDIREDRVNELRAKMDKGQVEVKDDDIAEKILERIIADEFIK